MRYTLRDDTEFFIEFNNNEIAVYAKGGDYIHLFCVSVTKNCDGTFDVECDFADMLNIATAHKTLDACIAESTSMATLEANLQSAILDLVSPYSHLLTAPDAAATYDHEVERFTRFLKTENII